MGNKHSSQPGMRVNDPTARSFSWQTEQAAMYGRGASVEQMPNPNLPHKLPNGQMPSNEHHLPHPAPLFLQRSQSHQAGLNANDIHDATVGRFSPTPVLNTNVGVTTAPASPSKNPRPTEPSDSGYFGMDSDPRRGGGRRQMRGSTLSLNEAVFDSSMAPPRMNLSPMGNGDMPSQGSLPHHGPMPLHPFMGRPPMIDPRLSPPPMPIVGPKGQIFHLPPHPFWPHPPPPDFDSKKLKKWRKKQEKMIKKGTFPKELLFPMHPPFHPGPMFGHPMGPPHQPLPPMNGGVSTQNGPMRAQSVDNLARPDQIPPGIGISVSEFDRRRFAAASHSEIGVAAPSAMDRATTPPTSQSHKRLNHSNSAHNSSSKGSRRSRGAINELTHFEEEHPDITRESVTHKSDQQLTPSTANAQTRIDGEQHRIYETMKADGYPVEFATSHTVVAEVIVNGNDDNKDKKLPVKISPAAQAILEKNAKMYQNETASGVDSFWENRKENVVLPPVTNTIKNQSMEESIKESVLEAKMFPTLPPKTCEKPKHFDPLNAWRSINVSEVVNERTLPNALDGPEIEEEHIAVRLVPILPSRFDAQPEPIYYEYNEKLPDFKKRLIETGTFDIAEMEESRSQNQPKIKNSNARLAKPEPIATCSTDHLKDVAVVSEQKPVPSSTMHLESATAKASATIGSGGGPREYESVRRMKQSMANALHRSGSCDRNSADGTQTRSAASTWDRRNHPTGTPGPSVSQQDLRLDSVAERHQRRPSGGGSRYASNHSLTPSTAHIKSSDMSDIDFSWVTDLETRMKTDTQMFDKQYEDVNARTLTKGTNGQNDPRNLSATQMLQRGEFSLKEAIAHSSPNKNGIDKSVESSQMESMPIRYFGLYEPLSTARQGKDSPKGIQTSSAFESDDRQRELENIASNVKSKAALFETEALKTQQEMQARQEALVRQRSPTYTYQHQQPPPRQREEVPYIPQPDYNALVANQLQEYHRRMSVNGNETQEERRHSERAERMNGMDTSQNNAGNRYYEQPQAAQIGSHLGNSRLAAYGMQTNGAPFPGQLSPGVAVPKQAQQQLPYGGRTYDATEYYRQHFIDDRNKQWSKQRDVQPQPHVADAVNKGFSSPPSQHNYHMAVRYPNDYWDGVPMNGNPTQQQFMQQRRHDEDSMGYRPISYQL